MLRKISAVALAVVASAMGIAAGHGSSIVAGVAARACTPTVPRPLSTVRTIGLGQGLWAAARGSLVMAAGPTPGVAVSVDDGPGIVRHVASRAGVGTAYVVDWRGGDVVVAMTNEGVTRIPQRVEALHPAWSSAGDLAWSVGSAIRIRPAAGGPIRTIRAPRNGSLVFSPVFQPQGRILAGVSSPATPKVPEDDRLNNLFRYDLGRRSWTRITGFTADADRWSVIRTPIARADGTVEFVRVVARASQTREPVFELWRLRGAAATKLRTLSGEMYLAGFEGGHRVWNVPDPATGRMHLERESGGGRRKDLGCGAVIVDPVDVVDPDRRAVRDPRVPARGRPIHDEHDERHAGHAPTTGVPEAAILVGDFVEWTEARAALDQIRVAYGVSAPAQIVDSTTAPTSVRPGVFAAVLRLANGVDTTTALAEFRDLLPEYSSSSWVVTP